MLGPGQHAHKVAPCVGAWIETFMMAVIWPMDMSRPAWARGLKRVNSRDYRLGRNVAPCVGAWIETGQNSIRVTPSLCRALRGRVD